MPKAKLKFLGSRLPARRSQAKDPKLRFLSEKSQKVHKTFTKNHKKNHKKSQKKWQKNNKNSQKVTESSQKVTKSYKQLQKTPKLKFIS